MLPCILCSLFVSIVPRIERSPLHILSARSFRAHSFVLALGVFVGFFSKFPLPTHYRVKGELQGEESKGEATEQDLRT